MPTPQPAELHHSSSARFQSGNRVYRIVILGQGGVGKSGQSNLAMSYHYYKVVLLAMDRMLAVAG